jgi:Transposase DDE domain
LRPYWLTVRVLRHAAEPPAFSEKDLGHWKLLRSFRQYLDKVFAPERLGASWQDPKRRLPAVDYLALFLFGLLNPIAQTLRGLAAASQLERVQREVCSQPVPRATFSDAQHVLEPEFLEKVFAELSAQIPTGPTDARLGQWRWLARDGSLFAALPRMAWALYGAGRAGAPNRAARLHLSLHVLDDKPVQAAVRAGRQCERAVWEEQWEAGAGYIADRYFGENYKLFERLDQKGCVFVIRLLDQAVIHLEEEVPLTAADQRAGVVRQAWVHLGSVPRYRSRRLRLVWLQNRDQQLILATNLSPDALAAGLVSELYRKRWRIELFFRWVKCILGCEHWLAESRQGATVQIYLALIAALLLQLYTGRRPTKRMMELIRFYLMGWATGAELEAGLARYRSELERRKKS